MTVSQRDVSDEQRQEDQVREGHREVHHLPGEGDRVKANVIQKGQAEPMTHELLRLGAQLTNRRVSFD